MPAIDKRFAYHAPSNEGLTKIKQIRHAYTEILEMLQQECPPSRELSVALTELETSAMWAVKAVVINDPDSTTPEA